MTSTYGAIVMGMEPNEPSIPGSKLLEGQCSWVDPAKPLASD